MIRPYISNAGVGRTLGLGALGQIGVKLEWIVKTMTTLGTTTTKDLAIKTTIVNCVFRNMHPCAKFHHNNFTLFQNI